MGENRTKQLRSRARSAGSPTSTRKRTIRWRVSMRTAARASPWSERFSPWRKAKRSKSPASGSAIRATVCSFRSHHWEKIDPATLEGIEKYLGSGMIKGHRPDLREAIGRGVRPRHFEVLSEEPLRILDVDGIGEARARRIMEAWQAQRGMQDVMVFLQGHGVGASLALRIYRVFGAGTIDQVRDNPYALAREVHGIGFLLADRLADQHRHPR